MTQLYRAPLSKTTTESQDQYLDEWKKITDVLEQVYGLRIIGFDPGVSASDATHPYYSAPVDMPLWFVLRLYETATQKPKIE